MIKILWWIQFIVTIFPRAFIFLVFGWTLIDDWDTRILGEGN